MNSRLGRRLVAPLLISFALALTAAPAYALQGWQAPVDLRFIPPPPPHQFNGFPSSLVMSSTREASVINSNGKVLSKAAGGSWGAPGDVLAGSQIRGGGFPLVTDGAGDLFTAWAAKGSSCGVAVAVAVKRASGSWGAPVAVWETNATECLENPAVSQLLLAANPAGDLVVVWRTATGGKSAIRAATKPAGGKWSEAQRLSASTESGTAARVAIDPAGDVTVVWQNAFDGQAGTQLLTASMPAGGSWTEAEALSGAGNEAREPQIAVDRSGEVLVAWCSRCFTEPVEEPVARIQVASKPLGGSWSVPEPISPAGRNARAPRIAVDPAGNTTAVWYYEATKSIQSAWRPAGGSWGEPVRIGENQNGWNPSTVLVVNAGGDAVVAWGGEEIEAAVRPRGNGWQPPTRMPRPPGALGPPHAPMAAVDQAGNAIVVWLAGRSNNLTTLAAEYYASPQPPSPPSLFATKPASPADDNLPLISGSAPTGSTVHLFTNSTCSGEPVASGGAAELIAPRSGLAVKVGDNTTTSFYGTASLQGETSNCSGPLTYTEQTSTAGMPGTLAGLEVQDPLTRLEDPLADFRAWSALPGVAGTGFVSATGWGSHKAFPEVEGAYWKRRVFRETGIGAAVSARLIASPGLAKRYFSLWLNIPSPATEKSGYELRFTETDANAYNAVLTSWSNGTATHLTSVEDVVLPLGSRFALADQGDTLSIWVDDGTGYVNLASVTDTKWNSGYAGIATDGTGARLRRFAAEELPIVSP